MTNKFADVWADKSVSLHAFTSSRERTLAETNLREMGGIVRL